MDFSNHHDTSPVPVHFAEGDTSGGQDLKWRITACLRDRTPELQRIHVTVFGNTVFGNTVAVQGQVCSLREKRRCLECCRHVPGVIQVVDELIVADESSVYRNPEDEVS